MQDNDRALLGGEARERPLQGITIVDGDRGIGLSGCVRPVGRQLPDADAPPPVPAGLLVTGTDEESVEPGFEALWIAELREVTPCEDVGLLDGILRALDIAEDPDRDRVAAVPAEVDELREGDLVAAHRSFDQPRLAWIGFPWRSAPTCVRRP